MNWIIDFVVGVLETLQDIATPRQWMILIGVLLIVFIAVMVAVQFHA